MRSSTQRLTSLLALTLIGIALLQPVSDSDAQQPTSTRIRRTQPPTNTPYGTVAPIATQDVDMNVIIVTATPGSLIVSGIAARLCFDCTRVRLRETPGTAGNVITYLPIDVRFVVTARSDDSAWLQITTESGQSGWVGVDFVIHLNDGFPLTAAEIESLPVTGQAVAAPPTATSSLDIPYYLSGVGLRARQIFIDGQSKGNRPNVFAKIGDSITASANFLYPIGNGQINYGAYGYLSTTVAYFSSATARTSNSFANDSIAAQSGWTTIQMLSPGYASPGLCGGQTPLECELSFTKPAIALIMLGTNDSGSGSPDEFAGNMRRIIETTITFGTIPVLSTIPPKNFDEEQNKRVDAYNRVIRQLCVQYEIPCWDYFSVMEKLPNRGMHPDGIHPNSPPGGTAGDFSAGNLVYGYVQRNLTALEVLDTLRRLVLSG